MARLLFCLLLAGLLQAGTALHQGRKVHFEVSGRGPSTLVLIHGWTCDGGFWAANLPGLAKRARVLVVDLPGHGSSDPLIPSTMEGFGDAVLAAMDAARIRKAVLVGHSMGGAVMLAVEVALRRLWRSGRVCVSGPGRWAMRLQPCRSPCAASSCWMRGAPYRP